MKKQLRSDVYEVEQLVRVKSGSDLYWRWPESDIIDEVHKEQILLQKDSKLLEIEDDWDIGSRVNHFRLRRFEEVQELFEEFRKIF